MIRPGGFGRRTLLVGWMQAVESAIAFVAKRSLFGGVRLQSRMDPSRPLTKFFPVLNEMAQWLAKRTGGIARSSLFDVLFNTPTTAHILGGAVIGRDETCGVVNARQEVFGYRNMLICDGSVVPANPGVNPSLTITAMTELAMSRIPLADRR